MAPKKKKSKFNLDTRLRSAIRQVWLRSPMRYDIIKGSRVGIGSYFCEACEGIFKASKIQVDHVDKVGKFRPIDIFVNRLFHGKQVAICRDCHKIKTKKERQKGPVSYL